MGPFDPRTIPGYAEAVAKEQANRELAFVGLPLPLCGVVVRQMTPRQYLLLKNCENRFIEGGMPREVDIEQLLWIVSPAYGIEEEKRKAFYESIPQPIRTTENILAIWGYFERTFQDAPPASDRGYQPAYTASVAWLVHIFGKNYGWSDEQTLETPLARLFQYQREIQMAQDPQAIMFNRSDRIKSEWLNKQLQDKQNNGRV